MYLILLHGKIYTNENQSNEMLGLCLFYNKIVCKDDVFLAFKATIFLYQDVQDGYTKWD